MLDSTPIYFDITAENTCEENGVTIVKAEKKNTPQKGTITAEKIGEIFTNVTAILTAESNRFFEFTDVPYIMKIFVKSIAKSFYIC